MDRPDRYPMWAMQPGLDPTLFAEPLPGTAAAGYPVGHKPSARNWNWMESYQSRWARHLDERSLRVADCFDTLTALHVVEGPIAFTIGGPLTQGLVTGGIYLWSLSRMVFEVGHEFTFAANLVQYLHARPQPDDDSRDARPDTLVSANASEPGYIAIAQITTGPATVTTVANLATPGVATRVPWNFREPVSVNVSDPTTAVDINYVDGATGLRIRPTGPTTSTAMEVDTSYLGADAVAAQFTASSPNRPALRGSQLDSWYAIHADGTDGGLHATTSASGGEAVYVDAAGDGVRVDAPAGDGLVIDAGGGGIDVEGASYGIQIAADPASGPQLIIDPRPNTPGGTPDGSVWHNNTDPITGLRIRTGSTNRSAYLSQDGFALWWNIVPFINSIGGTELVASINVFFRQGGVYTVEYQAMHGRSQPDLGLSWLSNFDARINGVTLPNSDHSIAPPETNGGGSGVVSSAWTYSFVYTHAAADAFVDVDLFATKPGGGAFWYVENPSIRVLCINS